MAKLSVIIPSRNERFLFPTIEDIFRNRQGECEVIAILDQPDWPEDWKELCAKYPDLHTIHQGASKGLRAAINAGAASAISRGAKYIAKFDGHCSFGEGFDEILKAECEPNWVVVPRRKSLEPESWTINEKPPIDYHYLSYPDNPNDFGGPGLNGRPWAQRGVERADILIDDEMSSQGSGWFMHAAYFTELELMDDVNYGTFWNEAQEWGLKCWLSGGQVKVNKKTWYAHLHKGKRYGRGYHLEKTLLNQGATFTRNWIWNEAWAKQTVPFKWLIEHFWPVPTWPEDWEKKLYEETGRRPRRLGWKSGAPSINEQPTTVNGNDLQVICARYGVPPGNACDTTNLVVTERLQRLVNNDSLDIIVQNSTLCPGENPFRGQRKTLWLDYQIGDGPIVTVEKQEKEWLIIGTPQRRVPVTAEQQRQTGYKHVRISDEQETLNVMPQPHIRTPSQEAVLSVLKELDVEAVQHMKHATALNDFLIRRFNITPYRLRAPMPIELSSFHRDDLAALFAELGFNRGAEIGVAEGKYSEVLVKANPNLELLCVDPWDRYDGNTQQKKRAKHEFAFTETKRRLAGSKAQLIIKTSMEAVRGIADESLDFVYIDANHSFDYCMSDLIEWSKKVRSGGIVAGDDMMYLDEKRWGAGPVEAVTSYIKAHRISLWFLCAAHRSVDFFFVKP